MIAAIADTHAAIWYLYTDARLSSNADAFMQSVEARGEQIGVSSITLVEMVYLIEKGRIPVEGFSRLAQILADPDGVFAEVPVDLRVARVLSQIDAARVPDMPDRIIAATALLWSVPLVSRDSKIRLSGLQTIW
jgi:PIN domain nuclease of toxin-antitoxin system